MANQKKVRVSPTQRIVLGTAVGEKFIIFSEALHFSPETKELFLDLWGDVYTKEFLDDLVDSDEEYRFRDLVDDYQQGHYVEVKRINSKNNADSFLLNFDVIQETDFVFLSISKEKAGAWSNSNMVMYLLIPFLEQEFFLSNAVSEEEIITKPEGDKELNLLIEEGLSKSPEEITQDDVLENGSISQLKELERLAATDENYILAAKARDRITQKEKENKEKNIS